MMMQFLKPTFIFSLTIILSACMSAQDHRQAVADKDGDQFTLGKIQRGVSKGMSQAQIVTHLGSPNIVTTDEHGLESWVYDKIASSHAYSSSSGGAGVGILGGGLIGSALLGGLGSASTHKNSGASQSSQKTLTAIIKFNAQKRVSAVNYHQSKF